MNRRTVAVFGSSQTRPGTSDWDDSVRAGEMLARAGYSVVTGGYGGTMEAVSLGAVRGGGRAIGITAEALFPSRTGANPHVTDVEDVATLSERIGRMMAISSACIAMPGSIGTAAELSVAWHTNHVRRRGGSSRIPVAAVGRQWEVFRSALVDGLGAISDDVYWATDVDAALQWIIGQLSGPGEKSVDFGSPALD